MSTTRFPTIDRVQTVRNPTPEGLLKEKLDELLGDLRDVANEGSQEKIEVTAYVDDLNQGRALKQLFEAAERVATKGAEPRWLVQVKMQSGNAVLVVREPGANSANE